MYTCMYTCTYVKSRSGIPQYPIDPTDDEYDELLHVHRQDRAGPLRTVLLVVKKQEPSLNSC